jgi:hypothetical protein
LICTASGFATAVAVTPDQFNALKNRVAKLEKSDKGEPGLISTCHETPQFYLPTSASNCTLNLGALGIKPTAMKIGNVAR